MGKWLDLLINAFREHYRDSTDLLGHFKGSTCLGAGSRKKNTLDPIANFWLKTTIKHDKYVKLEEVYFLLDSLKENKCE